MKTDRILLVQKELDLLKKHLRDLNLTHYNKTKLHAELEYAGVMNEIELPDDVIRIESAVEIREEVSGRTYNFQIVSPSEADMKKNKISVFAPIGIALMGYRKGSKVQWEMPDGIKRFTVLDVNPKK
jgi:regulator of nucleoside diphosphate kinase